MAKDILGKALLDYQSGNYSEDIKTYSSLDEEDIIPIPYLFRDFKKMPPLEQKALKLCKGSILDIGCGAGSHSLYLQKKGYPVTALDQSPGAIETCKQRGIEQTVLQDIQDFELQKYDTLLMLMNGIGIVGKLKNIDRFFSHLKSLLQPKGQILLDSSDIIYMYEEDEDGGYWIPDNQNYYGEVSFEMEYQGEKSEPLDWLYLDYNTLQRAANANNLSCELISQGKHYDYLAKLTELR
ncbi:class I SAM-dependent methyltransferase [Arenibacter sp. M-2]|uniref:class I SAM-dependent methyltransferase n=1 Tax=unclassified Arenibacter TaxID=2615047 RepID=UPI000D7714B2|nr:MULTISPECIES: class I SAM-dependent methyltransferase [unclassified Arenibacter]MDL5510670.1 class I SAM-dependent methyltransferase [Arenibacter sp. M-2]PXX26732.1 methyltransferase family protein [Arenibacter sp. ARW7G5Y1]|tara:strand:- start:1388 stop:2101 length:714 start_codon:yes stop_codon:yes gene_type:complete